MDGLMMIVCDDLDDFMNVIEGLVKRGLTFQANASKLKIKLLGGY